MTKTCAEVFIIEEIKIPLHLRSLQGLAIVAIIRILFFRVDVWIQMLNGTMYFV